MGEVGEFQGFGEPVTIKTRGNCGARVSASAPCFWPKALLDCYRGNVTIASMLHSFFGVKRPLALGARFVVAMPVAGLWRASEGNFANASHECFRPRHQDPDK